MIVLKQNTTKEGKIGVVKDKNLIFLLDYSGSMFSKEVDSSGLRRIDVLKEKIESFLNTNPVFNSIEGYRFSSHTEYLGKFDDPEKFINELINYKDEMEGGTQLWDAIYEVIEELDDAVETYLVCITDGEDNESFYDYSKVTARASQNQNLHLHIIDIEGSLKRSLPKNSSVIVVEDLEEMDVELAGIVESKIDKNLSRPVGLDVSIPLVNLVSCNDVTIDMAIDAVRRAIPYLEELTGYRYYPVTTFLTDKLDDLQIKPSPPLDPKLFKVICEMLGFLQGFCLSFHMRRFFSDFGEVEEVLIDGYKPFSDLKENISYLLRLRSEALLTYVYEYLKTGEREEREFYYIDGLHSSRNPIFLTRESLTHIIKILENIKKRYPFIHLRRTTIRYEGLKAYDSHTFDIESWEKYMSKDECKILKNCLDDNGGWRTDIDSVIQEMKTIAEVVFRLIYRYQTQNGPYSEILRKMHLWGMYSSFGSSSGLSHLQRRKFNYSNAVKDSGKVFICLKKKKKSFEEMQSNQLNLNDYDFANFLLSVIIHEHTHAITSEGILTDGENITFPRQKNSGKKEKLVSESLAEWSELNYFRNNDILYELVLTHASSDTLLNWPYAGALIFEKHYNRETGYEFFRSILNEYRKGDNKAYQLLIGK